jgi:hypothetical protein
MNKLLLNNRSKDSTPEEFIKAWNNASYVTDALLVTIQQLIKENTGIKKDDFSCPNHYAKLAYEAGMNKAYETIAAMLPQRVD